MIPSFFGHKSQHSPPSRRPPFATRCVTATRFHGEILSSLMQACFESPWSRRGILSVLEGPGGHGLILQKSKTGEPVGFSLFRVISTESELLSIGVTPQWQGTGFGQVLMAETMSTIRRYGAVLMFLEVAATNKRACQLYHKHGFIQVGQRPGYYRRAGKQPVTALVLRADLCDR